jgi:hypothetical protein
MSNPFLKEQKLFSIISPCYGDDWKHLQKNAQTLNEQEYKKFEWIIVFDGKSKQGEKELTKLKKKYKFPISWHTIKHAGAPAARNYGATVAKGDYFCFLNADNYLYPEALRMWANAFEDPKINRVWGLYDNIMPDGSVQGAIHMLPRSPNGEIWYEGFKYSNYCDSTLPIRRSSYIPWDETVKSLQDWDWAIRQLKRDNFQGKDWKFIDHSFFMAEAPEKGGLSDDSHQNWIERTDYIRDKNGIPKSDIVVCSIGAANHGFHIAQKLGADYLPMPSYKAHKYKLIYLIGFYTAENPQMPIATSLHMQVFADAPKAKKIIHWVGTDIYQLRWNCCFEKIKAIKDWMKKDKIINLTEVGFTRKELKEVGIGSKIIPIPPKQLNDPIPLPKDFAVAIYESSASPMYHPEIMTKVMRAMPDIKFYLFGEDSVKGQKGKNFEHLGYIKMDKWMSKFSCNLRISLHDGLPLLPIEFMTAGRQVITNVPVKGAIVVKKTIKDIIAGIRKAQKETIDPKWGKYWKKEMDYQKYAKRVRRLI